MPPQTRAAIWRFPRPCFVASLASLLACASFVPTAQAQSSDAPPATLGPGYVFVHIDSPARVDLQRRNGDGYRTICTSPGDAVVPANLEFRVSGEDIRPSPGFSIAAYSGRRVVFVVDRSPLQLYTLGLTTLIVGAGAVGVGAFLIVPIAFGDDPPTRSPPSWIAPVGLGLLVAGGAAIVAGILVWIPNWRTGVSIRSDAAALDRKPPRAASWGIGPLGGALRPAFIADGDRAPTTRGIPVVAPVPGVWLPVVSGTF